MPPPAAAADILSMPNLYLAPRPGQMPNVSALLDAVPGSERDVANALGVSLRTVRRWRATERAPRPALIALFWSTRWGSQWIHATLVDEADLYRGYCDSLKREVSDLHAQVARLQAALDEAPAGAANCPIFERLRA